MVAVLQHDKYERELRVEAAMTLVAMQPRGGRAVGILGGDDYIGLLEALYEMPARERRPIIEGMVPGLVEGMKQPVGEDGEDESVPYKDAAYALLTHENGALVPSPEAAATLKEALVEWATTDFERRHENTSQLYGMEQVLRLLREAGVRHLTPLIEPGAKNLREVAKLISELGDEQTKKDASERLAKVATFVDSEEWVEKKKPAVAEANKASGLEVTERQFKAQLETYQEEELLRVFGAMKSVGQTPAVDYLLSYAQEEKHPDKRRAAALAALEGNLRDDPKHAKAMLDFLTSDDAPDALRDVAARRVGELSRDQVADRLYALFDNKRWQVRWTVASLLLKMSEDKHLDEFMGKLGDIRHMAMDEALTYGPLLADVKRANPEELVKKYAAKGQPPPVRVSVLGYYYKHGDKTDLSKVQAYEDDKGKVPKCPPDADRCAWECSVEEKGKTVSKEIETVGQYVEYCIVPSLKGRDPEADDEDDEGEGESASAE